MRSLSSFRLPTALPFLAAALLSAAGAPACAQSSAEVRATVHFVEPGGIGGGRDASIASGRAPARGAVTLSGEPGAYVVSGAPGQVVSVEAPAALALVGASGRALHGTLRQTLQADGGAQRVQLQAAASVAAGAAPELYRGAYSVVANFN